MYKTNNHFVDFILSSYFLVHPDKENTFYVPFYHLFIPYFCQYNIEWWPQYNITFCRVCVLFQVVLIPKERVMWCWGHFCSIVYFFCEKYVLFMLLYLVAWCLIVISFINLFVWNVMFLHFLLLVITFMYFRK
jgi:hypothetical protein